MAAILIGPYEEGQIFIHKLGCPAAPHQSECREAPEADDPEKALAGAKKQILQDADAMRLCPKCWPSRP